MMPLYKSHSQENYIFTDEFVTKGIIWNYYEGFSENFRAFLVRKMSHKSYKLAKAGCWSYGLLLVGEIILLVEDYKKSFNSDELKRFKDLYYSDIDEVNDEDLFFLRDFFNKFLTVSGMKNISRVGESDTPAIIRKN